MAHLSAPIDPESECESRPLLRIDTYGLEHRRVDHSATAELDPSGLGACAATVAQADSAGDLELRRRFGEREVRRRNREWMPAPKYAPVKVSMVPARSAKLMSRSTDEPFNLVEDRRCAVRQACRGGSNVPGMTAYTGGSCDCIRRIWNRRRVRLEAEPCRALPRRGRRCPTSRAPDEPAGC